MGERFPTEDIKLEGGETSENVTEIQSYLEGFQREIEGTDAPAQQINGKCLVHYGFHKIFNAIEKFVM